MVKVSPPEGVTSFSSAAGEVHVGKDGFVETDHSLAAVLIESHGWKLVDDAPVPVVDDVVEDEDPTPFNKLDTKFSLKK